MGQDAVKRLEAAHAAKDRDIAAADRGPSRDEFEVGRLKREKLAIRDEIEAERRRRAG